MIAANFAGLKYEDIPYDRENAGKDPVYLSKNPNGTYPLLET